MKSGNTTENKTEFASLNCRKPSTDCMHNKSLADPPNLPVQKLKEFRLSGISYATFKLEPAFSVVTEYTVILRECSTPKFTISPPPAIGSPEKIPVTW